jgi:hypothetical protein
MAEVADAPVAAAHGVGRLRLTGSPEHERSQIFVAPNAASITRHPAGVDRCGDMASLTATPFLTMVAVESIQRSPKDRCGGLSACIEFGLAP